MGPNIDYSALPLRDIHLPDAVSWWPPAIGWWLLLAAAIAAAAVLAYRRYRMRRHRAALAALARVRAELESGAEPVDALGRVSVVLRRFAMSAAADEAAVPGLTGLRWLEYLDAHGGGGRFRDGPGRRLLDGPYRRDGAVDRGEALAVLDLAAAWVRMQRPASPGWLRRLRAAALGPNAGAAARRAEG